MGIRGLNNMIKKISPECVTENSITKYKNTVVAIDCSILIYKFRYASKIENAHLIGIVNRIKFYMMNNILPVFIFDGVPPDAKRCTIEKRQNAKYKLYKKIDELKEIVPENEMHKKTIDEEIEKISSQIIVVKKRHIDECKELLEKSGIPYFYAPEDAEKYCAFLQKNGLVDYTITDDTDAMTFGCKKILKTNINNAIVEIDLEKLLEDFKMSYKNFVDYCILCGCDYSDTLNQIGPITAYNIIIKHGNIENYLKQHPEKNKESFNYLTARKIFAEFNYDLPETIKKKSFDKELLLDFLKIQNFSENVIKKFIKILN